jgi:hypothetical protein
MAGVLLAKIFDKIMTQEMGLQSPEDCTFRIFRGDRFPVGTNAVALVPAG